MADLAIAGGTPVRATLLPYGRQSIDDADRAAVLAALDGDWLTQGPAVETFEAAIAARCGTSHAVAVSSGTAALHVAMLAAGLGAGDAALTTPLTFAATATMALHTGATVAFADVDPATLNIEPAAVAAAIDERTKVVLPVHFAGQPCDMTPILAAARGAGAAVIEDACHALGATRDGRSAGSFGDAGVLSFHPVKHVTTFEGGAVVTDDAELAARARRLRNHGIDIDARGRQSGATWRYDVVEAGFNYRLPDVACALGTSQPARLDDRLAARRLLATRYLDAVPDVDGVQALAVDGGVDHAWHIFPVLIDAGLDRDWVVRALRAENIGVNVHYQAVHLLHLYRELGHAPGELPIAEDACERLVTLPLHAAMTDGDVDDVVEALLKVLPYAPQRGA